MPALARRFVLVLPVVVLAACQQIKSANPLSPSVAGPIAGVSVEAPRPMSPAASSQIAVDQQPITLTIQNATTNGVRPLTYVFEIATDSGFKTKVFTQTAIPPGDNGRTSLRLSVNLTAERTYYWHAKADDGANASDYSPILSFQIYTPVVIEAPELKAPDDGATTSTLRPSLTVTNAARTGPAGAIQYLIEVATDPTMAAKVVAVPINEGPAETRFTLESDLSYSTRYYWRAKAMDTGHEGPYSKIRSFTTLAAPVAPPVPPSPPGGAAGDQINMSQATILNSPFDLASWPVTSAITSISLRPTGVHVDFDKADGRNRWPDVFPPGWDEPLQYTLGMCLNISSKWYCSAPIQFWYGLYESGGPPERFAAEWFYDPARWAPMTGHQPAVGEIVGFFVCAGNCRNNTRGDNSVVRERTNVVLLPFPGSAGGTFRF